MIRFSEFIALALLAVMVAVSSVSHADGQRPFDLYQPIIDKCLFGPLPDDPTIEPSKASRSEKEESKGEQELAKEQEQLEKAVSVTAFQNCPDGKIRIGFKDSSKGKNATDYYIAVGERKDGWLVKSADLKTVTAVLEKDGIEIECVLGQGSPSVADKSKAGSDRSPKPRSPLLFGSSGSGGRFGFARRPDGPMSRRSRRRFNEEEERRADEQREERFKKAEAAAALRREQERAEDEAARAEQREQFQELKNQLDRFREQKAAAQGQNETGGVQ